MMMALQMTWEMTPNWEMKMRMMVLVGGSQQWVLRAVVVAVTAVATAAVAWGGGWAAQGWDTLQQE